MFVRIALQSKSCKSGFFALALLVITFAGDLNADTITSYSFTGDPSNVGADSQPSGGMASDFIRKNLIDLNQPNVFRSGGFIDSSERDFPQGLGFSVTANAETLFNIDSLTFDNRRNSTGPTSGAIQYSLDSFSTIADSFFFNITTEDVRDLMWDFSDFSLLPGQTVEFRFYGFNLFPDYSKSLDESSSHFTTPDGFWALDNVILSGSSHVVPEPGGLTYAGISLACFGLFFWVSNRRKNSQLCTF